MEIHPYGNGTTQITWGVLTGLSLGPEDKELCRQKKLPNVADAEKESLYGYVFGVSGPGK